MEVSGQLHAPAALPTGLCFQKLNKKHNLLHGFTNSPCCLHDFGTTFAPKTLFNKIGA
jgi:hypothetical protein